MDTIFALSTAEGKSGVAIIRISGTNAVSAVEKLCGAAPDHRKTSLRVLKGRDGSRIDEALILKFEEGASFTGEKVIEIQCHGSNAVVSKLLDELAAVDGFRLAEPGEFTRRALENGRLDLAQVEGLSDLIDAETDAQRLQANRVLSGELGQKVQVWRKNLIKAAALLEATIDFADEEVPEDVRPEVKDLIDFVLSDLGMEIEGVAAAERVRSGFEVAIIGAPNVGKSTLFNRLAKREAAITSEHAGTTRDVIEVRMDLDGLPVTMLDTAGLRKTTDPVEAIGVDRATSRAKRADLRVVLLMPHEVSPIELDEDDIVLAAKSDLRKNVDRGISGLTGAGITDLIRDITKTLKKRAAIAGIATHSRHRNAMQKGQESLFAAKAAIETGGFSTELAAEDLRGAIRSLDSLVGRIDVENLLDEIFSSFCIGK